MATKEPKMGEIIYLGQKRASKQQALHKQEKQEQSLQKKLRAVRFLYGGLLVCLILAVVGFEREAGQLAVPIPAAGQQQTGLAETSPIKAAAAGQQQTGLAETSPIKAAAGNAGAAPATTLPLRPSSANASSEEKTVPSPKEAAGTMPTAEEAMMGVSQAQPKEPLRQPAPGEWSRFYGYGYDTTWQDYRFHPGVDMALPEGSEVSAVGAGTIKSLEEDPLRGMVLKLALADGMVAVYGGITPKASLQVGDLIGAGQVIGAVAPSPAAEGSQPPHVHLELLVDGKPTDPAPLLP